MCVCAVVASNSVHILYTYVKQYDHNRHKHTWSIDKGITFQAYIQYWGRGRWQPPKTKRKKPVAHHTTMHMAKHTKTSEQKYTAIIADQHIRQKAFEQNRAWNSSQYSERIARPNQNQTIVPQQQSPGMGKIEAEPMQSHVASVRLRLIIIVDWSALTLCVCVYVAWTPCSAVNRKSLRTLWWILVLCFIFDGEYLMAAASDLFYFIAVVFDSCESISILGFEMSSIDLVIQWREPHKWNAHSKHPKLQSIQQ